MLNRCDVVIVGGGIVGLASAMALLEACPDVRVILLEKESSLGAHQTSHNSGVLHSGISYRPGSLKAATCVAGARLMVEFCQAHGIPYARCGKLVVATRPEELPRLQQLSQRGQANGVPGLALIGPERLREFEPQARGVQALHVPSAGVVDYTAVAQAMAADVRRRGGEIRTAARVVRLARCGGEWVAQTPTGEARAAHLITCAGLFADRLSALAGSPSGLIMAPFRGDYYELVPERRWLVRTMIYPVPDPRFPFLGVHLTRDVHGKVHAGPNAVLAWKREGYARRAFSLADTLRLLGHPGVWRLARRHWRTGLGELWRATSKRAFVREAQRLVPAIQPEDLVPGPSGVRAQALDAAGSLLDDFRIVDAEQAVHVLNVPSPAATASLRIGQLIAERSARAFELTVSDAWRKMACDEIAI
jgi:L-2-hydroxyglutarate oxidase LhgO